MTAGDRAADPRWSRQVRFAPLGPAGQRRLGESCAVIVGVGALGTHVASWLVRAGIGRLILVDRDVVEPSNLARQVLFDERDARMREPKATAAAARLSAIRSDAIVDAVVADFDPTIFAGLPARPALLIDGSDNFRVRYLINDLAIEAGLPWIHGAALGAEGRAMVVLPGETPCLRCLLPEAPPRAELDTCETAGVLATAVAQVAAFQTTEAIKLLAAAGTTTRGMLVVDVWHGSFGFRLRDARPDPACRSCGTGELPALREEASELISLCGRDAVQVRPPAGLDIDLARLAARLDGVVAELSAKPQMLRFVADGCRFSVFAGGRALLFGVDDPSRARILYDRWVGALP